VSHERTSVRKFRVFGTLSEKRLASGFQELFNCPSRRCDRGLSYFGFRSASFFFIVNTRLARACRVNGRYRTSASRLMRKPSTSVTSRNEYSLKRFLCSV